MSKAEIGDLIVYSSKGYTMNFGIVYALSGDFPMVHEKQSIYRNGAWSTVLRKKMASVNYLVLRTSDGQGVDERIQSALSWHFEEKLNSIAK